VGTTPTWDIPLPADGQSPWGDDYREAMELIDERLFAVRGSLFVEGNTDATPTEAAGAGVMVKAVLTGAAAGPACRFCEIDGNRLTYLGPLDRVFTLMAGFSIEGPANRFMRVAVFKNGSPVPGAATRIRNSSGVSVASGALVANVEMSEGDFLELFVANLTGPQDLVVQDVTLVTRG
jgi:hypothetical protein